jgi:hypothetical protein
MKPSNAVHSAPRNHRPISAALAALASLAFVAWCGRSLASGETPKPWTPPDTAHQPHEGIQDSPGYVPLVDPESTAVLLGRRVSAPLVSTPFSGGTKSLDQLGRTVCRVVHHKSLDSLMTLCVSDREFKDILWPEFPNSRPVTGIQWDFAWMVLYGRLHGGCSQTIRDYGGHYYEFLSLQPDSIMQYKNFKMYSRISMFVRNEDGQIEQWKWLRAVVERKGRYKIYSTTD